MSQKSFAPEVVLRIPGDWSHPRELVERLPPGVELHENTLSLPDGTEVEITPLAPDNQFPAIFRSSCRSPASDDELAVLDRYRVNVVLSGVGGSLGAALGLLHAGAAIVKAGGAGVFIDNSALAHGGEGWVSMANDGGPDAISYAFVSIIRGEREVYTMGMQVLGYPDLLMKTADLDPNGETIVNSIRYICAGSKPVDVGHVLADLSGPKFQVVARVDDQLPPQSVMHNPRGRLKIVSIKDIEAQN